MSTIVYQGVHSYFESQLIETTTLKLKLASCMVGYETKEKCHIQETNYKTPNLEFGDWSSIQTLSNGSYTPKETTQKQSFYIHPLTKTSPRLSQQSLELCTENLGSETGSDDTFDINIMSLNPSHNSTSRKQTLLKDDQIQKVPKQMKSMCPKACNFPPPLTTMKSPNSIQVRPYREDGRLIIEAFETPSRNNCLQAERSNGRLILSFLINDSVYNLDPDHEMTNEDSENDGIKINAEDETRKENIQRSGRCKENQHGNKSSCFWRKPECVATS